MEGYKLARRSNLARSHLGWLRRRGQPGAPGAALRRGARRVPATSLGSGRRRRDSASGPGHRYGCDRLHRSRRILRTSGSRRSGCPRRSGSSVPAGSSERTPHPNVGEPTRRVLKASAGGGFSHRQAVSDGHRTPCEDVLELVGWTPLVRLKRVAQGVRTPVYGKCEFMNPGGSVKDRIGRAIIEDAEKRGELKPGGTVVEATAGSRSR